MDDNGFGRWVGSHRWQLSTAVLAAALVVLLAVVVTGRGAVDEDLADEADPTEPDVVVDPEPKDDDGDAPTGSGPFGEPSPVSVTAVIVDNVPDAGLQVGIDSADLLIEVPVEGGLTRFTALYGEQVPDLVGPVRSLRPVSADLLALFRPVVFNTGGQRFVVGSVEGAGVVSATPAESFAFQTLERPQPYHMFVSPGVEEVTSEPVSAPWAYGEWAGGEAVSEVSIPFGGGVAWRFEDGVFVRYRDGRPVEVLAELDADPVPLTRTTLILLVAHQKSAGYTDSAGAEVPTFDVIGGGELYLLHNGEMIRGRWSRASQADGYGFASEDGIHLNIPPGALYLGIIPRGVAIDLGR